MQDSVVQQYVELLIRNLGEESKHGKEPFNLREWFNYYAFDVIGNLGFGSDFSGLEHSKHHMGQSSDAKCQRILFSTSVDVLEISMVGPPDCKQFPPERQNTR